ncbi:MAG TPA: hypothetical protein VJ521_11205 [Acidobacteriota bacterium]|nr:hypothetical protein [Acidobacteriota bacterium]
MFLLKIIDALDRANLDYAVAGGYAVSLHGAIRGTLDVDLIIRQVESDYVAVEAVLRNLDLRPHLPVTAVDVFRFRREYMEKRNVKAWSFSNPDSPSELVDILIAHDLRKIKTKKILFRTHKISIVALSDLIRIKKISNRPQDLADVEALEHIKKLSRGGK